MSTPTPITEAVLAALVYVRNNYDEGGQWDLACDKMQNEILNKDRGRGAPQLAAAARILADEVERLRAQPQTADYVSGCCHAKTETAGHKTPGIKVWFWCTSCRKPCDIFFRNSKPTQP